STRPILLILLYFSIVSLPPRFTLFPYTTLFRSCHADYFDFERIEALKPAIEACGISTLSQSPMLGFHKQMDNRINSRFKSLDTRSEERFSRNAETDLVCRLLLEKKKANDIRYTW